MEESQNLQTTLLKYCLMSVRYKMCTKPFFIHKDAHTENTIKWNETACPIKPTDS